MKRWVGWVLISLASLALSACVSTNSETENRQRYATLVTGIVPPSARAHAIEVSQIDDRRFHLGRFDPETKRFENSRTTHRVSPGEHQVFGIPIVRDSMSSPRMTNLNKSPLPLVANFESGRRYYLAVERSETDRRRWQVTIYKVVDTKQGLLDLE